MFQKRNGIILMFTLKNFHDYDIIETFNAINNLLHKTNEKYKTGFFDKILKFVSKKQKKYSFPLKVRLINQLNFLLSCSDNDITRATAIFRNIDRTMPPEKHHEAGHFKNLRKFWTIIAKIFANDPQIKEIIHWENPGIDQPVLKAAASAA